MCEFLYMFATVLEYLEYISHFIQDVIIYIGWIIYCIYYLFLQFFNIIKFIFNFFTSFIYYSFSTPIVPELSYNYSTSSLVFFDYLPYWSEVKTLILIAFLILGGIAIIKLFLKS